MLDHSISSEESKDQAMGIDRERAVEFSCDVTDDANANMLLASAVRSALRKALPTADWKVSGTGTSIIMESNGRMNAQVFRTDVYENVLRAVEATLGMPLSDAPKPTEERAIRAQFESDGVTRAKVRERLASQARNTIERWILAWGRTTHDVLRDREQDQRRIRTAALQRDLSALSAHLETQRSVAASLQGSAERVVPGELAKES